MTTVSSIIPVHCFKCGLELKGSAITHLDGNPVCSTCWIQLILSSPIVMISGGYTPPGLSEKITELEATCDRLRKLCLELWDYSKRLPSYDKDSVRYEEFYHLHVNLKKRMEDEGVISK